MDEKFSKEQVRNPLLQGDVAAHSRVIFPPGAEERFPERWFRALSESEELHRTLREFDAHWEYEEAVEDLNRNGSLFCQHKHPLPFQPHLHFQLFLWRELQVYRSHLNRVVETNRSLRECSETLAAAYRQFEIRVGDLLREYATNEYGKRLSLRTIARLVLLVYICAELALDIEGNLTICGSNPPRHLSVDRTYETLRDAGLR